MHPMLNIATRAARAGGRVLTKYMDRLGSLTVESKGKNDFVSEVDRLAEAEIVAVLSKAYPDHQFLCEESGLVGAEDSEYKWYIDPLDGTANFLRGQPMFSVSIAVAHKGRLEQAVVYDPVTQELFEASRGAGATLDGKRIRVSGIEKLEDSIVASGFDNNGTNKFDTYMKTYNHFATDAASVRQLGSAALMLAYVAAGRLDAYWQYDLKQWDIAAGALLVREAGGLIADTRGEDSWLESGTVLAATPRLFDPMVRSFAKLGVHEIN